MVNLPWPLEQRSQLVPHKLTTAHQCFIQALLGEGNPLPPREAPEESKIPHDFKIMFTK